MPSMKMKVYLQNADSSMNTSSSDARDTSMNTSRDTSMLKMWRSKSHLHFIKDWSPQEAYASSDGYREDDVIHFTHDNDPDAWAVRFKRHRKRGWLKRSKSVNDLCWAWRFRRRAKWTNTERPMGSITMCMSLDSLESDSFQDDSSHGDAIDVLTFKDMFQDVILQKADNSEAIYDSIEINTSVNIEPQSGPCDSVRPDASSQLHKRDIFPVFAL